MLPRRLIALLLVAHAGAVFSWAKVKAQKEAEEAQRAKEIIPEKAPAPAEDPTCAAGLVVDIYENGASENPTRLELSGAQCRTAAAFQGAASFAACGDAAKCEMRDAAGRRAVTCAELLRLSAEEGVQPAGVARAYAVPRDMRFVFATERVGFRRTLPHLDMVLVTLAERPRLFALENFLTAADADRLVADALAIDDDEHRLMQSSTGAAGYRVSSIRTSENAWVKDTPTARKLKKRAFEFLGFDSYDERMADGVQVLRYNNSNGYVAHKDYLSRPQGVTQEQMDPKVGGANRMATVFLYLSDVRHGGQTVFPLADRPPEASELDALESRDADAEVVRLRDAMAAQAWEPGLVDQCYSRLAAAPKKGRAILFYSQHPDGSLDNHAQHGGCPILDGQKWAANLWVWNKAMPFGSTRFAKPGETHANANGKAPTGLDLTVTTNDPGVELFWVGGGKESKMGPVVPGEPFQLHSFDGHKFVARRHGSLLREFTVTKGGPSEFAV